LLALYNNSVQVENQYLLFFCDFASYFSNFAFLLLVTLVVNLHAKFDISTFNHSQDMEGVQKFKK